MAQVRDLEAKVAALQNQEANAPPKLASQDESDESPTNSSGESVSPNVSIAMNQLSEQAMASSEVPIDHVGENASLDETVQPKDTLGIPDQLPPISPQDTNQDVDYEQTVLKLISVIGPQSSEGERQALQADLAARARKSLDQSNRELPLYDAALLAYLVALGEDKEIAATVLSDTLDIWIKESGAGLHSLKSSSESKRNLDDSLIWLWKGYVAIDSFDHLLTRLTDLPEANRLILCSVIAELLDKVDSELVLELVTLSLNPQAESVALQVLPYAELLASRATTQGWSKTKLNQLLEVIPDHARLSALVEIINKLIEQDREKDAQELFVEWLDRLDLAHNYPDGELLLAETCIKLDLQAKALEYAEPYFAKYLDRYTRNVHGNNRHGVSTLCRLAEIYDATKQITKTRRCWAMADHLTNHPTGLDTKDTYITLIAQSKARCGLLGLAVSQLRQLKGKRNKDVAIKQILLEIADPYLPAGSTRFLSEVSSPFVRSEIMLALFFKSDDKDMRRLYLYRAYEEWGSLSNIATRYQDHGQRLALELSQSSRAENAFNVVNQLKDPVRNSATFSVLVNSLWDLQASEIIYILDRAELANEVSTRLPEVLAKLTERKRQRDAINIFNQYGSALAPDIRQAALVEIVNGLAKIGRDKNIPPYLIQITEEPFVQETIKNLVASGLNLSNQRLLDLAAEWAVERGEWPIFMFASAASLNGFGDTID